MYTAERLESTAEQIRAHGWVAAADMIDAYAATLKAAQGGVTEAMVERGLRAAVDVSDARLPRYKVVRLILEAALSAQQGQGEVDREFLGKLVRMEWMAWAREQPEPKPSWLIPWDALTDPEREVDRRIGERIYRIATDALYAPPAQPAERVPEVFIEQMDMLLADFRKYENGDPSVPFVVVRDALVAALNEWTDWRESASPAPSPAERVPEEWLSEQVGGDFDEMTAGQGYRRGWNDCRASMLAASPAPSPARGDGGEIPDECPAGCNGGYFVETTTGAADECQVCGGTGIDESQDTRP